MDADNLNKFFDKWNKFLALLACIGAVWAYIAKTPWLFYIFAFIAWCWMAVWLLSIVRQKRTIRNVLLSKEETLPTKIYTKKQQSLAAVALLIISISFWGWIGWQFRFSVFPKRSPKMMIFPESKFGIIVAEFTRGSRERTTYSGGADVRDKLYNDLLRLVAQQELNNRVEIQQAGSIKNEQQALDIGDQYEAGMVIWGYIPVNQPQNFRPSFTLIYENEDLQALDPVLFGVEITGGDVAETTTLLTERVQAVSSFILGLAYLAEGEPGDYERAVTILTEAINEANAEVQQNLGTERDLLYNLGLFHLTRGRAYAAMNYREEALADYDRALEYWPNLIRVYTAIGNVYYADRDFEKAKTYYEKAEYSWHGSYGLGLVAYQQEDYYKAIQYFNRSLNEARDEEILPGGQIEMKMRFTLGMAYKKSGDWQRGRDLINQVCLAEDISPDFRTGVCLELTPALTTVEDSPPLEALLPTGIQTPTPYLETLLPTGIQTPNAVTYEKCNSPGSDWDCDCISSQFWTSFSDSDLPKQRFDCLELMEWGIVADDGILLLFSESPNISSQAIHSFRRGIYTTLPREATITFELIIDTLQTNYTHYTDLIANITFGVSPSKPFDETEGTFLIYQVEGIDSPVHMKTSVRGGMEDYLKPRYTLGGIHEITIEKVGLYVSIYVNGNLLIGPSTIPPNPAFWIGYLLPRYGRIDARISGFSIQDK